ncbi:MAG: alpha/beta hydrolase [Gammaproteobacteria bacterium]|nr:alpha/beta hydrolase [Gammaproteobacteria bacterium]
MRGSRRRLLGNALRGLVGAGAALPLLRSRPAFAESGGTADDVLLPGRLGNPDLTMIEDPRLDPRVRRALAAAPPGGPAAGLPTVTLESSYEQCLDWVSAMERTLMSQDSAALAAMPAFDDLAERKEAIPGDDGGEVDLYLDMPKDRGAKLPCVVHIHGGGMAFTTATRPAAVRWRKSLARQGMLVVGVEFRNAGGVLGNHPFPGGLTDGARAVHWGQANRDSLGASSVVGAGEAGGGNLAVATAVKANLEGWVEAIDGVFAMAPMILGFYTSVPPELLSWRENQGYQGTYEMMRAMTKVYDPQDAHETDPMAWPFHATESDLKGMPPHIVTNYELDLIRDDGAVFARKLLEAGVPAVSRTIDGAVHVAEIAMPDLVPDLARDTVQSLVGFANSLRT